MKKNLINEWWGILLTLEILTFIAISFSKIVF